LCHCRKQHVVRNIRSITRETADNDKPVRPIFVNLWPVDLLEGPAYGFPSLHARVKTFQITQSFIFENKL